MPDKTPQSAENDAATRLISLADAAKISGLSAGHLRLLVKREKLWGIKIGRNWITSEEAVRSYLSTDRRPGPKPQS